MPYWEGGSSWLEEGGLVYRGKEVKSNKHQCSYGVFFGLEVGISEEMANDKSFLIE